MTEHTARTDPTTYAMLAAIADMAHRLNIRWMVTGATSRVLLLESVYGLPQGRATLDVDFDVWVESWEHYQQV